VTIKTAQYTVGTTRSVIVADDLFPEEVHIHIQSGSLYIGGSDVTTSNGLLLDANTVKTLSNHDNPIYAVTSTGTTIAYVMVISK
jgi:hypothetical protein